MRRFAALKLATGHWKTES